MKKKVILTIGFIIVQCFLAFAPFMPAIRSLLPATPTPRESLEWQLNVLGLEFGFVFAFLGVWFLLNDHERREFENDLKQVLPPVHVCKLRDDEFYADFLAATRKAKQHVWIMYLAPYPPNEVEHAERRAYYRDLLSTIKRTPHVRFRRIVRTGARMAPWISELVQALSGVPNVDLAVLNEKEQEDMPLALSVQIIDSEKTWFVALGSHERAKGYRDLFIESAVVADAMTSYYERLWARSSVFIESGRVTTQAQSFIERIKE